MAYYDAIEACIVAAHPTDPEQQTRLREGFGSAADCDQEPESERAVEQRYRCYADVLVETDCGDTGQWDAAHASLRDCDR